MFDLSPGTNPSGGVIVAIVANAASTQHDIETQLLVPHVGDHDGRSGGRKILFKVGLSPVGIYVKSAVAGRWR